jgi:adhesin/invasin
LTTASSYFNITLILHIKYYKKGIKMRPIKYLIMVLFALLMISGCNSESAVDSTVTPVSSSGLKLSTPGLAPGNLVSHGGQITIRAYVFTTTTNSNGDKVEVPVEDGTLVNFFVISTDGADKDDAVTTSGRIDTLKTTVTGYADAVYTADAFSGVVKIYAETDDSDDTYKGLSDTTSFEVASGDPAAILIDSVTPETIGVAGSGTSNTTILAFSINDNAGNPVPDDNVVTFKISTPIGGGEKLSATDAKTQNGKVFVTLISGTVSGTVGVNASYLDDDTGLLIATEAKVTIVSGLSAAEQLGMAVEFHNIAGGRTFGLQDAITVYLGDRYGNVVPDGTRVSFMTEGGTIGTSGGFEPSTVFGVAEATLQSSPPSTPDLAGVTGAASGNVGLCRIVAYTPGDEGFNDVNGNNIFDEGVDILTLDMSEPYIDANDNGAYDSGEKYIDSDGNGAFTDKDGQYQSNTIIWDSVNVLFSAGQAALNLSPTSFNIDRVNGGTYNFSYYIGDVWGNSLVGGTTVKVSKSGEFSEGELAGFTNFDIPDSTGSGQTYSFSLIIPPAEDPADPPQGSITIRVEVTPNSGSAGANTGSTVFTVSIGV